MAIQTKSHDRTHQRKQKNPEKQSGKAQLPPISIEPRGLEIAGALIFGALATPLFLGLLCPEALATLAAAHGKTAPQEWHFVACFEFLLLQLAHKPTSLGKVWTDIKT